MANHAEPSKIYINILDSYKTIPPYSFIIIHLTLNLIFIMSLAFILTWHVSISTINNSVIYNKKKGTV